MTAGGRKDDGEKPRLELLSRIALWGVARVLTFGAKKYEAHNWRQGIVWSRLVGAALRHITAFMDGEDLDDETGLSHIDHALCELMFLSELFHTRKDLDDRWKHELRCANCDCTYAHHFSAGLNCWAPKS